MGKNAGMLIAAGLAVAVVLAVGWPLAKVAMLRRKAGVIEQDGFLFDPATRTYYRMDDGAVVYQA